MLEDLLTEDEYVALIERLLLLWANKSFEEIEDIINDNEFGIKRYYGWSVYPAYAVKQLLSEQDRDNIAMKTYTGLPPKPSFNVKRELLKMTGNTLTEESFRKIGSGNGIDHLMQGDILIHRESGLRIQINADYV